MSQSKVKEAVIAGAVLATSLAIKDSIYSLLKKYFPLPEDEFFASMATALITVILLIIILWLSTFYITPEEKIEEMRKKEKLEYQQKMSELADLQKEMQIHMALKTA